MPHQPAGRALRQGGVEGPRSELRLIHSPDPVDKLVDDLANLLRLLMVGLRDRLKDAREAREPVAVRRRKVGATVERLAVWGQKHRHRPAAAAQQQLDGFHINFVDVGSLFAIDLDVDEQPVHQGRDLGMLERLPLHDMAPVAGGVPYGEQDRFIFSTCPGERLIAPRIPVDRVVGMLQQVRTGLGRKAVWRHRTASSSTRRPSTRRVKRLPWVTRLAQKVVDRSRQIGKDSRTLTTRRIPARGAEDPEVLGVNPRSR